MNAMEAHEKLALLNERIEALNGAYKELWRDFDNRLLAVPLNKIQAEYEQERAELIAKMSAVHI